MDPAFIKQVVNARSSLLPCNWEFVTSRSLGLGIGVASFTEGSMQFRSTDGSGAENFWASYFSGGILGFGDDGLKVGASFSTDYDPNFAKLYLGPGVSSLDPHDFEGPGLIAGGELVVSMGQSANVVIFGIHGFNYKAAMFVTGRIWGVSIGLAVTLAVFTVKQDFTPDVMPDSFYYPGTDEPIGLDGLIDH